MSSSSAAVAAVALLPTRKDGNKSKFFISEPRCVFGPVESAVCKGDFLDIPWSITMEMQNNACQQNRVECMTFEPIKILNQMCSQASFQNQLLNLVVPTQVKYIEQGIEYMTTLGNIAQCEYTKCITNDVMCRRHGEFWSYQHRLLRSVGAMWLGLLLMEPENTQIQVAASLFATAYISWTLHVSMTTHLFRTIDLAAHVRLCLAWVRAWRQDAVAIEEDKLRGWTKSSSLYTNTIIQRVLEQLLVIQSALLSKESQEAIAYIHAMTIPSKGSFNLSAKDLEQVKTHLIRMAHLAETHSRTVEQLDLFVQTTPARRFIGMDRMCIFNARNLFGWTDHEIQSMFITLVAIYSESDNPHIALESYRRLHDLINSGVGIFTAYETKCANCFPSSKCAMHHTAKIIRSMGKYTVRNDSTLRNNLEIMRSYGASAKALFRDVNNIDIAALLECKPSEWDKLRNEIDESFYESEHQVMALSFNSPFATEGAPVEEEAEESHNSGQEHRENGDVLRLSSVVAHERKLNEVRQLQASPIGHAPRATANHTHASSHTFDLDSEEEEYNSQASNERARMSPNS